MREREKSARQFRSLPSQSESRRGAGEAAYSKRGFLRRQREQSPDRPLSIRRKARRQTTRLALPAYPPSMGTKKTRRTQKRDTKRRRQEKRTRRERHG